MERILIIGGNGCGKTTLSRKIAKKLALQLVHLDFLYWRDNWQNSPNYKFDKLLINELLKPKCIIDGNMNRTLPLRLKYCNTIIFMDFLCSKCIYGAIKRTIKNYGTSRFDMGGICPERFDKEKAEFIHSIW